MRYSPFLFAYFTYSFFLLDAAYVLWFIVQYCYILFYLLEYCFIDGCDDCISLFIASSICLLVCYSPSSELIYVDSEEYHMKRVFDETEREIERKCVCVCAFCDALYDVRCFGPWLCICLFIVLLGFLCFYSYSCVQLPDCVVFVLFH